MHRGTCNENGIFTIDGVTPGVYGLVIAGEDRFVAYGLQIVAEEEAKPGQKSTSSASTRPVAYQAHEDRLEIDSLPLLTSSLPVLRRLVNRYVRAGANGVANLAPVRASEPPPSVGSNGVEGWPVELTGPEWETLAPSDRYLATTIQQHTVHLVSPDDRILGRVRRLEHDSGRPLRIYETTVYLIRNEEVIAVCPVDELGVFTFADVKPGLHSLVAAGADGFAAFSISVVPAVKTDITRLRQSDVDSRFHLASQELQRPLELSIELALIDWEICPSFWQKLFVEERRQHAARPAPTPWDSFPMAWGSLADSGNGTYQSSMIVGGFNGGESPCMAGAAEEVAAEEVAAEEVATTVVVAMMVAVMNRTETFGWTSWRCPSHLRRYCS